MGPDGRQVFEEGLAIPIMPLAREGRMNEDLLRLVRANVREPLQVEGDIYACAACNDEGSRRLDRDDGRVRDRQSRPARRLHPRSLARGDAGAHPRLAAGHLSQQHDHGRLRQAACAQCRVDDCPTTASTSISTARRRRRATASTWCCNYCLAYTRVRRQMPGRARRAEQCRLACADHGQRAGRLRAQCEAAVAGGGAAHRRPDAARRRRRLPASGHLRRRAGRRRVVACGIRRFSAAVRWSTKSRRAPTPTTLPMFSTVIFHCGGAGARPEQGRIERHVVSVGRAHDPGGGDREHRAGGVSSPRVSRELGRRRQIPRRARSSRSSSAAPAPIRSRCCAISSG